MIELLIKDNDTHINDIILQAFGNISESPFNSRASPENISDEAITVSPFTPIETRSAKSGLNFLSSGKKQELIASPAIPPNVWQERAAIREMKKGNSFGII